MKLRVVGIVLRLLMPIASCGWCMWEFSRPEGRLIEKIDIGGGRTFHIWSEQSERDWLVGPVCIYYAIQEDEAEIIPTSFVGVDRGQKFEFKTVFAEHGRLICVYEVNLAAKDSAYFFMYDTVDRQSWPSPSQRDRFRVWCRRYRKLREANPEIPRMDIFEQ